MSQNIIEIKNVSKTYGDNTVLNNLSLNIRKNEFLTLLGPSGCGKTTTLKILAGFENSDIGKVLFNNEDISALPPYKRQLNTVFQKYALFPHMNVYENIAFGLKIKKVSKNEIDKKVSEMLKLVALEGFEKRSIDSLSGGQQQRVAIARALVNENVTTLSGGQQQRIAIARALVNEPKVLLLDEPLGALDLKLRKEMQSELKRIQQRLGITFIFVTHDQEEALTMSDTIVVMNKGIIQQMGSPEDIYNEPANAFVADFIGESNIVDGIMLEDLKVEFCNHVFTCVDKGFNSNEVVDVVIRPEDIEIISPEKGMITGKVNSVKFKGVHYEIEVIENEHKWIVHNIKNAEIGAMVGLNISPESIHIMRKVMM